MAAGSQAAPNARGTVTPTTTAPGSLSASRDPATKWCQAAVAAEKNVSVGI